MTTTKPTTKTTRAKTDKAILNRFFYIKLSSKSKYSEDKGMSLVVDRETGWVIAKTNKPIPYIKLIAQEGIEYQGEIEGTVPHVREKLDWNTGIANVIWDRSFTGLIGVYRIGGILRARCQNKVDMSFVPAREEKDKDKIVGYSFNSETHYLYTSATERPDYMTLYKIGKSNGNGSSEEEEEEEEE